MHGSYYPLHIARFEEEDISRCAGPQVGESPTAVPRASPDKSSHHKAPPPAPPQCLICMVSPVYCSSAPLACDMLLLLQDAYTNPVVSVLCWHVYCQQCWLKALVGWPACAALSLTKSSITSPHHRQHRSCVQHARPSPALETSGEYFCRNAIIL